MTDNRTFYEQHNYADQCCREAERMEQPMKYPEVMNSGIEVPMWYCEKHKEYFSNNCSECMLEANESDIRSKVFKEAGVWLSDVCPHTEFTLKRDCYRCREQLKAGKLGG